jgi:hypothetical protein
MPRNAAPAESKCVPESSPLSSRTRGARFRCAGARALTTSAKQRTQRAKGATRIENRTRVRPNMRPILPSRASRYPEALASGLMDRKQERSFSPSVCLAICRRSISLEQKAQSHKSPWRKLLPHEQLCCLIRATRMRFPLPAVFCSQPGHRGSINVERQTSRGETRATSLSHQ